MRRAMKRLASALALMAAATSATAEPALLHSELLSQRVVVAPGTQVTLAIRQRLQPGWHTYWRNPGNIGQPTRVNWSLPGGWRAGDIRWPTPVILRTHGLTNFVYADRVLLPVTLSVPAGAAPGPVRLSAEISSLLCREVCIPSRERLSLTLQVAAAPGPEAPDAAAIARALRAIDGRPKATGVFEQKGRQLTLAWPAAPAADGAVFFPLEGQGVDTDAPMPLDLGPRGATLTLTLKPAAPAPTRLDGVVGFGGMRADVELAARAGSLPAWAAGHRPRARGGRFQWALFIVLGFGGGLLLNAMPCVFPILAAKAAALAGGATRPGARRREALAYTVGAVAAFVALAGVLVGLRAMGHAAGWGFQLQSPVVVATLAVVMMASALNLAGLFDAGLWLQRIAGNVRVSSGDLGAFITGALAAVVAAPCTAPLMTPAMGWAATQAAPVALAVFGVIGLGLAAPFALLASWPALAHRLPMPGAWVARLRQMLAFPMLGGAAWLCWVFAVQRGAQGLAVLLAVLIGTAFALWCWGVAQRDPRAAAGWRIAARAAAVAVVGAGLAAGRFDASPNAAPQGVDERWSDARVQAALAQGHPVLVDVTAAWCITCQVNESVALRSELARQALRRTGTQVLKADWTEPDARITDFLSSHGRSGVPFYLLYTPDHREIELPQILTPGAIADALQIDAAQTATRP